MVHSVSETTDLSPTLSMSELMHRVPGARRALFRLYHIGGCQSCAFSPEETLEALCRRNSGLDPHDVLARILEESEREAAQLLEPADLKIAISSPTPPDLIDLRTQEEFDTVHIPGSTRLSQPLLQEILQNQTRNRMIVLIDHRGERSLDGAAYFVGHGLENVRALRGGIDAWAAEIDSSLPRYEIESA